MKPRMPAAVALLLVIPLPLLAGSPSPSEMAQTAAWVAGLQNADGGFAGAPGGASSLAATNMAAKVLRFTGGSIRDVPGAIQFVERCFDPGTGGFVPAPGGKPDAATTAIGLMAASELKMKSEPFLQKAIGFFHEHAKTFPDVRMAAAGLEGVNATSPDFPAWTELVRSDRNPDGTWGQGPGKAFATGGAAVTLLRMGQELDHRDAVLAAIREGQDPDGGWSDGDRPADLPSSYRVMRCFFMLKEKPDLDRLLGFIARRRNSDGGYAPAPGKPSELPSTYYATVMTLWARLLTGEPALVETAGFQPLCNGKDLDGWEGDQALWAVRDGMIVGTSKGLDHNDFLATKKSYGDFILKFTFRLRGGEQSNSGVQFRSVRIPGHEMSGYQADIGQGFWGCLYDESRRNRVLVQASREAQAAVRPNEWNYYVIRAMGDQVTLTLNGVPSVTYREEDPQIARDGKIALQIHAGGPMTIEFKDLYIQELPIPKADDATTPGFHLRTVKASDGERKYTVFVPQGYDGSKPVPAVLFLHGAGERGDDGIRPAQVGLGAAIAQDPSAFSAIAVFPQARRTWAADSPDAAGALAALDDVMKAFRVDPKRVSLTGLSMGGRGSWELAAAHPERFSAVVPICGPGRIESIPALKALPVWSVVGDADRDATVQNLRAMFLGLREAGGTARMTEYRGVGHNSWDRAYNDAAISAWLVDAKRP